MNIFYIVLVVMVLASGCGERISEDSGRKVVQTVSAQDASRAIGIAIQQANNNDHTGLLTLYKIARNEDSVYGVEYRDVALQELEMFLYKRPELWIKTFASFDLKIIQYYINFASEIEFPKGNETSEQLEKKLLSSIEKINGDQNEERLIDYIQGFLKSKNKNQWDK